MSGTIRHRGRSFAMGHATIGGSHVAYLELPNGGANRVHWAMAIDGGVSAAVPLSSGPIVPARPMATDEEILARLPSLLSEGGRDEGAAWTALSQAFGPDASAVSRASDCLRIAGWRGQPYIGWEHWDAMDAWRRTLIERLGGRDRILKAFLRAIDDTPVFPPPPGALDDDEACERVLRLSDAETTGVMALAGPEQARFSCLLPLAIRDAETDLAASKPDLQSRILMRAGVTASAVRRIPDGMRVGGAVAKGLLRMPVDWLPMPDDRKGWEELGRACLAMSAVDSVGRTWPDLGKGSRGRWGEFLDRCARAAFHPEALARTTRNPRGFVIPAAEQSKDVERAFVSFLSTLANLDAVNALDGWGIAHAWHVAELAVRGNRSLPSVLGNSRDWHGRFRLRPPPGLAWDAVLPSWTHPATGIEFAPLSTSEELIEEGDAMDHCVGGQSFALGNLRDTLRIVSLRRGGVRLSTAEIRLGPPLTDRRALANDGVVQHRGPSNVDPDSHAREALRAYVELPEVVAARLGTPPRQAFLPVPSEDELRDQMERWRPFLTGEWRHATIEDLRGAVEGAADDFDPTWRWRRL